MSNKGVIIVIVSFVLLSALGFGSLVWCIKDDKNTIKEINEKLVKEQTYNSTCSTIRDSLARVNADLSKYKTLTMAMIHRDEATSQLKYKRGDIVYMKSDSARVVIDDVLIGGGKYHYYVEYEVTYKDNSTKRVAPELIY